MNGAAAPAYRPILQRTGMVLLVVGVIDIGVMFYCIANDIGYASSLNVFAAVAGIFMMRGSLRTASNVHGFAAMLLMALMASLLALPFFQPLDLTMTYVRLNPFTALTAVLFALAFAGLAGWVTRELGRPVVQEAIAAAGVKQRRIGYNALIGLVIVVLGVVFVTAMHTGESATRARDMAQKQLGPGYHYHVTSLSMTGDGSRTNVSAQVTAWKHDEIRTVPVSWSDP